MNVIDLVIIGITLWLLFLWLGFRTSPIEDVLCQHYGHVTRSYVYNTDKEATYRISRSSHSYSTYEISINDRDNTGTIKGIAPVLPERQLSYTIEH